MLKYIGILLVLIGCVDKTTLDNSERPNVILILTDDQGYGDLGFHGNPHIMTPTLDQLAKESTRFNRFFVSPVCAPTRASLMTGRHSLRTGIHDTYNGGAIMAGAETTVAELMANAGYATGLFGKWHLGDNYPSRPQDQGFQKTLHHLGGGIGQPGDWPNYPKKDSSYFDPSLWSGDELIETRGYCSDVFADAAVDFISQKGEDPFFVYLAFNAPHDPLQLPQEYYDQYKELDPSKDLPEGLPHPEINERQKEIARKVYGMVTNIDDNVKKVLDQLDRQGIADNTLVIFMTDNGPWGVRYRAGLRRNKGSVYQGGVQVPSFWRLPGRFEADREISQNAAHIDLLPTLAELCGLSLPQDLKLDGMSLLPALEGKNSDTLNTRDLPFYWNRRYPNRYQNMTLVSGDLKLVGQNPNHDPYSTFQLFDLNEDPYEQNDLVTQYPENAALLKMKLDDWYTEMITSPHLINQQPAIINPEKEHPTILSRNDAGGVEGVWNQSDNVFGLWEVAFEQPGKYDFVFKFNQSMTLDNALAKIQIGTVLHSVTISGENLSECRIPNLEVPAISGQLIPQVVIGKWPNQKRILPFLVEIHQSKTDEKHL